MSHAVPRRHRRSVCMDTVFTRHTVSQQMTLFADSVPSTSKSLAVQCDIANSRMHDFLLHPGYVDSYSTPGYFNVWEIILFFLYCFDNTDWVTRRTSELLKPVPLIFKALISNKWRKKTERKRLAQIHVEYIPSYFTNLRHEACLC